MMREPVHILQATTKMGIGGVQTFLMNYARLMDPSRVVFDFAVQTKEPQVYDEEIQSMGGMIYPVRPMTSQLEYYRDIVRICKEHPEIKIVHSHLNYRNYLPLLAAKKARVSVRISHSHTCYISESRLKQIARKMFQLCLPLFSTDYWGCSKKANEWLYGCRVSKAIIIQNAIDIEKYRFDTSVRKRLRQELGLDDNCTAIVHVGTFGKIKNQQFLIKLFSEYHKRRPSSKLLLCGDGDTRPMIEEQIGRLQLNDSVLLLGMVTNVPEVLMAADVFVLPSLYEGFALSLVEAQASGLPAVSSAAAAEAIFMNNCQVCVGFDTTKWMDAIDRVYTIPTDRGAAADETIKAGFDIRTEAKNIQNMYIQRVEGVK